VEQAFANNPVLGWQIWTLHSLLQSQGLAIVLAGKLAASLVTLDPSSREIAVRRSAQNSRCTARSHGSDPTGTFEDRQPRKRVVAVTRNNIAASRDVAVCR
jgi:hypothetical protein